MCVCVCVCVCVCLCECECVCVCVCVQVEVEEIDTRQHSDDTMLGAVPQSPDTVVLPPLSLRLMSAVDVRPYGVFRHSMHTANSDCQPILLT